LETADALACANVSGAVRSTRVPVASAVPTACTVAVSRDAPVPMLTFTPGARFTLVPLTAVTLMFVSPTADAAASVVETGGI
jgi:hypothetical protein